MTFSSFSPSLCLYILINFSIEKVCGLNNNDSVCVEEHRLRNLFRQYPYGNNDDHGNDYSDNGEDKNSSDSNDIININKPPLYK